MPETVGELVGRLGEREAYNHIVAHSIAIRHAITDAVAQLDAEHYPDPELKGRGGCVMCWPKDGSWPCVTRLVADELRGILDREDTDA